MNHRAWCFRSMLVGNGQFSEQVVFEGAGLKSEATWDSFFGAMKI